MASNLDDLLKRAKEAWNKMTPEQREKMLREQRESYVRAETSWPKPRFHYENGVKVYESYEDYCND